MKILSQQNIRELEEQDLLNTLQEARIAFANLKLQVAIKKEKNTSQLGDMKKYIARLSTQLTAVRKSAQIDSIGDTHGN